MADKSHYNKDVKVPESVIEEIRKLGMEKALKKAESGSASKEFVEGVRRFYPGKQDIEADPKKRDKAGAKDLAKARANASKDAKSPTDGTGSDDGSSNRSGGSGKSAPVRRSTPGGEAAIARRLNGGGKDPKNSPMGRNNFSGRRQAAVDKFNRESGGSNVLERFVNKPILTNDGKKESINDRNKRYGRKGFFQ